MLIWFGVLGVAAIPVADAGGLGALWLALVAANLLQAVHKTISFLRGTTPQTSRSISRPMARPWARS
jgi:hypothetical protein